MEKSEIKLVWEDHFGNKHEGKYRGEKKDGVPHGIGVFYFHDKLYDKIEGEWKNSRLSGKTVTICKDGNYGECEYKNGMLNGNYIYYKNDGHL